MRRGQRQRKSQPIFEIRACHAPVQCWTTGYALESAPDIRAGRGSTPLVLMDLNIGSDRSLGDRGGEPYLDEAFRAEEATIVLKTGRCINIVVSDPRGERAAEVWVKGAFPL
jgi:hypothetical protein